MRKTNAVLLASGILAGLLATSALAQSALPKAGRAFVPPKNSYGQPDITGTWTNATLTPLERDAKYGERQVLTPEETRALEGDRLANRQQGNAPTDPSLKTEELPFDCGGGFTGVNCGYNSGWTDSGDTIMRVEGQPRTSFITSTPNGRVPAAKGRGGGAGNLAALAAGAGRGAAPAAGAGRGAAPPAAAAAGRGALVAAAGRGGAGRGARSDNPEGMSLAERCLTSFGNSAGPVMLPLLYNNNYRIQQGHNSVAIWVEMVHDVRVINLGVQHRTDGVRPWWGDSIGHYEGNTLVVETTNYHPRNAYRGASEDLKVTERFTRTGPDRLKYQFTVESPSTWDQPWGGEYEFGNSPGIYEYACHEGNYALEGMLAGARAEEATAAARAGRGPAPATN